MTKIIKLNLLCLISFFFLISSKQAAAMVQDTSAIVAGTVKLTGKIISPNNINKEGVFVNVYLPQPISGENVQYRTFVDLSGNFSIDVEVESNITLIGIYTSINSDNIFVKLTDNPVTNITITYDKGDEIENIGVKPAGLMFYDMARGIEAMGRMIEYSPDREPEFFYDKSADDFLEHAKTSLSERLQILDNDSLMSEELKDMLENDFRLILYKEYVFP